ncbi:MORN repeat-containing protein 3 [Plasmodiophora brassicae]|uniref:MORN repeat-containing protein 3 n=1 Tax=Plasmodiophora brassicae TaxID=37360 RepID=A0A3P3Y434_PLABS|nr:unnamed protein product [Plasmodiophora brassicae]
MQIDTAGLDGIDLVDGAVNDEHGVAETPSPLGTKSGPRKSMFWVSERKLDLEQRIMMRKGQRNEKIWDTTGSYIGDWKDNQRNGFGVQIWPNGCKYEGEWLAGRRHGKGTYFVRNKASGALDKVYSGQWQDDLKDGVGIYNYNNGNRYEGQWKQGQRHGTGSQFYVNGDVYIGEWLHGKMNGWGRYIQANGNEYAGEWLNGLKEGAGHFFYRDRDMVYEGEWVKGIPQCGVFGPIDKDVQSSTARPIPVPKLDVLEPDRIVEARLQDIQATRASVRALPLINVEDLFNKNELADLQRLFDSVATAESGHQVSLPALTELLLDVGLNPADDDMSRIVFDFDKGPDPTFSFQEFVKSIYLVKQYAPASESVADEDAEEE